MVDSAKTAVSTSILEGFEEKVKGLKDSFNIEDEQLLRALSYLDRAGSDLRDFDGADDSEGLKKDKSDILDEFIREEVNEKTGAEDLGFETKAKRNGKPWRVVIDFPVELIEGKERLYRYKAPVIQFCSGSPKYDQYVLSFKKDGVIAEVVTNCAKTPTQDELQNIVSGVKDSSYNAPSKVRVNLKQVKEFYDNAGIQRIAILGMARVFPNKKRLKELENKKSNAILDGKETAELNSLFWATKYAERVKKGVGDFFKYLDEKADREESLSGEKIIKKKVQYTTVNGGWAGIQEKSEGVPKMASKLGLMHSKQDAGAVEQKDYGYYPPITIMPQGGNHDRVKTMADIKKELVDYVSKKVLESFDEDIIPEDKKDESQNNDKMFKKIIVRDAVDITADATYFEIPGVWGNDSRFLVDMSTSLLIFDPHGLWTDIEKENGIVQGKPVAIIADPENLTSYGSFNTQGYVQKEGYRVYKEAADAAKWINQEWGKVVLQKMVSSRRSYNDLKNKISTVQSWMKSGGKARKKALPTESKDEKQSSKNSDSRDRSVTI